MRGSPRSLLALQSGVGPSDVGQAYRCNGLVHSLENSRACILRHQVQNVNA